MVQQKEKDKLMDSDCKKKLYQCCHCTKKFAHSGTLDQHQRRHTKDYRIHCTVCRKGFYTKGELNRHKTVHMSLKEARETFKCNLCDAGYTRKFSLELHIKSVHFPSRITNSFKSTSPKPKHECRHCGKFSTSLRRHMFIHDNVKQYKCGLCNSAFTERSTLRSHYLAHKKGNIFFCSLCKIRFHKKNYLEHLKALKITGKCISIILDNSCSHNQLLNIVSKASTSTKMCQVNNLTSEKYDIDKSAALQHHKEQNNAPHKLQGTFLNTDSTVSLAAPTSQIAQSNTEIISVFLLENNLNDSKISHNSTFEKEGNKIAAVSGQISSTEMKSSLIRDSCSRKYYEPLDRSSLNSISSRKKSNSIVKITGKKGDSTKKRSGEGDFPNHLKKQKWAMKPYFEKEASKCTLSTHLAHPDRGKSINEQYDVILKIERCSVPSRESEATAPKESEVQSSKQAFSAGETYFCKPYNSCITQKSCMQSNNSVSKQEILIKKEEMYGDEIGIATYTLSSGISFHSQTTVKHELPFASQSNDCDACVVKPDITSTSQDSANTDILGVHIAFQNIKYDEAPSGDSRDLVSKVEVKQEEHNSIGNMDNQWI